MPGMAAASTREKILHPSADALDLATIMRTVGDPVWLEVGACSPTARSNPATS